MADKDQDIEALFGQDPEVRACPYAHYDRLREQPGLYFSPTADAYVVTRHADAVAVLSDPDSFSSKIPFGRAAIRRERDAIKGMIEDDPAMGDLLARLKPRRAPMLSSADAPVHLRQRRLLQNLFSTPQIIAAEPFVRDLTSRLIDGFDVSRPVEVVSALAVPLPVQVIAVLMGVEPEREADFKRWSDGFVMATGHHMSREVVAEAIRSQCEFFDYLAAQVEDRRRAPRDDLVSQVIAARQEGDEPFTNDEVVAVLAQMLVAGNETTTGLIGSCLLMLAQRPDLVAGLRDQPAAIPRFVEEVLRLESPGQANFRTVTKDAVVNGCPVEAGSQVMVVYGAANRDPTVFGDAPLELGKIPKARHVAFGHGVHFCLGAPLARMEAKIVVETMLDRFETIGAPEQHLDYVPAAIARALARLELNLTPRAG